jgi:hypothetical protein
MTVPTLSQIKQALIKNRYQFLDDGRLYHLNIIGIRAASSLANTFDDLLALIYSDANGQHYHYMACTTKPGLHYLNHPDNPKGVAILAPGQYLNLFVKGLHKGQYPCLVQNGTLEVFRDNKRDGSFDYSQLYPAPVTCGLEIHHANNLFTSVEVNNWSAGCQVIANPDDFGFLMKCVNDRLL